MTTNTTRCRGMKGTFHRGWRNVRQKLTVNRIKARKNGSGNTENKPKSVMRRVSMPGSDMAHSSTAQSTRTTGKTVSQDALSTPLDGIPAAECVVVLFNVLDRGLCISKSPRTGG
jgi:ribosomal protein L3